MVLAPADLNLWLSCALGEMNTVSVTYLSVADATPPSRWWQSMCPAEQKRADAFHFSSDRNAYISAHALLRHKLAHATGLKAADLRFAHDAFGKPSLVNSAAPISFNLSHSRGMVAVAMVRGLEVGVDVEASGRVVSNDLAIAEQNFTPREISALKQCSDAPSRREFFCWLWTRKEAILKATGKGLSMPLNSFCVIADDNQAIDIALSDDVSIRASLGSKNLEFFFVSAATLPQDGATPDFHWEEIVGNCVLG